MAFEDFLRTVPLVHKHIMRTRLMMHENKQLRKFLKRHGIDPKDVISSENDVDAEDLEFVQKILPDTDLEVAFKTVATSLREEQKRAAALEASLYVLQIDYNHLLLNSANKSVKSGSKPKTSSVKRKS
ncbi:hypothetical protein [Hellea balneolensis]|uniref:hypothetical protein n=1 Tax=Hellea balneolensis TaxID=287478 RepID=UPI000422CC7A|nr:hypothetical protein [Hellea balneolensis]